MKPHTAAITAFVASAVCTFVWVRVPASAPAGWFEVDGRPVKLDGEPVADWRQVNGLLAYAAAEFVLREQDLRSRKGISMEMMLDRTFELEIEQDGGNREVLHVSRFLPAHLTWTGGSSHPVAYSRYEVVRSDRAAR